MIAKMSANVGGQAVLEGVMMRTPSSWSVAVRRPDGGVSCVSNPVTSPASRRRWLRLPVIRGVVALGESLAIGFRALAISASVASIEEGDDGLPTGEITRGQMIFAFAVAIGFTVIVFKVSPAILTELLPIHNTILFVLVEGVIRVSLLIGYLYVIGLIPDLNRVFQYRPCEGPQPGRHSGIPCLDYHIERCKAPCVGYIDKEAYREVIEYRREVLRDDHPDTLTCPNVLETDLNALSDH